ncbi:hypothetical protein JW968_02750 [Candidatus Woesearchaeota archaeon]|nr:hypothetical protein [Candidatus Woesearchaeota archaeon]
MKLSDLKECPDCGSPDVAYSKKDDELVCRECGLILNEFPPELEKKFRKSHTK